MSDSPGPSDAGQPPGRNTGLPTGAASRDWSRELVNSPDFVENEQRIGDRPRPAYQIVWDMRDQPDQAVCEHLLHDLAIPYCGDVLKNGESAEKCDAAKALGELSRRSEERFIPIIAAWLADAILSVPEDDEYSVLESIVEALQMVPIRYRERETEKIVESLKNKKSRIRANAAQAIGILEYTQAVEALIELFREDAVTRLQTSQALGRINTDAAEEALSKALESRQFDMCTHAAAALAKNGKRKGETILWRALKYPSLYDIAFQGLKDLGLDPDYPPKPEMSESG